MPHGIILLATPKNAKSNYLLSEQPSNHDSHATSCALIPFSNFCASTKSTRWNLTIWQNQPFLTLQATRKSSTSFYARFDFWLGITLTQLAHVTKGVNTSSRVLYLSPRPEGTNASSGTSYLHSWCTSHDLPSFTKSLCWELSSWTNSMFSHAHHLILRSWRILLQKWTFSFE